jgi:hypothetical protein
MHIPDKTKSIALRAMQGSVISTFFNFFLGRCTFFAICFSIAGVYGWLHGRDLTSFALFVTAVQGLLVLHSWKQDVAEQKDVQSVVVDVNK